MEDNGRSFLRAFRAAALKGAALELLAADPQGFAAALESDPEALGLAMDAASDRGEGVATVSGSAFAAAACSQDGRILASDAAFAELELPPWGIAAALRVTAAGPPRLSAIVDDRSGRPVAVAVAGPDRALAWPLSPAVREALLSGAARHCLMGVRSAEGVDWPSLFSAWAFTGPELRLSTALVRRGKLRAAASDAAVAYETARETLASAMAKTGAKRQPDFVRQLAQLAFGDLPSNEVTWRTLADTYSLTDRQARLALLTAFGATRSTAAAALGVTDQSAKADLKTIYGRCGVDSGAALGRLVAETGALARLASATDVEILGPDAFPTPLRFVRRRRLPGRIAVEDHGPLGAAPVVVFHTPTSGRHLPRTLVRALQAQGLRPISVERPGFGLTSPAAGDVVDDANADLIDVLDGLGIERVRLLGRSITMPMRFAAAYPRRVERGVLISATPPGRRTPRGFLGAFVGLALDHPRLVTGFARMMGRLSSERAILRLTERAIAESPSDNAAIADQQNRDDWIRASRQSASGDGFSREFVLHADGGSIPAAAYECAWTVLIGMQDGLRDGIEDPAAMWREAMPRGRFQVVDGGRLLHLSHPDLVASALNSAD